MSNRFADAESRQGTWGNIEFWYRAVKDESSQATASRVAQGIEGQRIDVVGVVPTQLTDFSGGMVRRGGIHTTSDLNQVWYNEGLRTDVPFQLTQGYKVVTDTDVSGSVDHSGFRAANKRFRGVIFNGRFVGAAGSQLYKDTSTSDPAITVPATADGISDLVTALWTGMVGTTPAVFMGSDGTTDDIQYTTDPFSDTVSWTKFVTLSNSADHIAAAQYMPAIGDGYHVILGRIGNSPTSALGLWYVSKDASLPATAQPVVYKDTKDIEGAIATVTTSNLDATVATTGPSVTTLVGGNDNVIRWSNVSNVLASDDSRAVSGGAIDNTAFTPYLYISGIDTSSVPNGAILTGLSCRIEARKGSDLSTAVIDEVSLVINGSVAGISQASQNALTTSDANYDFGSSTNSWGTRGITGRDLKTMALRTRFAFDFDGTGGNVDNEVDYFGRVAITYRMPGTQVKLQSGGFTPGLWPSRPNTLVYIEPETDDETAITKQRRLVLINLEYDPDGERVVASVEYPDTGLSYVEDVCPWQGGLLLTGNKSSGLGKQLKHMDSQGRVRQYNFPGFHGTTAVGIATIFDEGTTALLDVVNEDETNAQWWRLVDGQFHACYPLQSKSNSIAKAPLAWAERTLHKPQNRVYRFFPVSTTSLAGAWSFVPRNPFNDPLSTNTTEVKQDGPLYLITPEFEIGQFENENSILLIRHGGAQISATSGSYGTVQYDVELRTESTAIDTTFATPDVTTGALDAAFEEYKVTGSGKPFRTAQLRVTLNNAGSSSTKTANGLPFYMETKSARPHLSRWLVLIDWEKTRQQSETWLNFIDRIKTQAATQRTQTLKMSGIAAGADIVGWNGDWVAEDIAQPLNQMSTTARGDPKYPYLQFQEVRVSTS